MSGPQGAGGGDLFAAAGFDKNRPAPLADRLRPQRLEDVVGQEALLGPDRPLGRLVAAGELPSLILHGPPGAGKTTIARLLAGRAGLRLRALSAVMSGVAELRKAFEEAEGLARMGGEGLALFVDEIHRFNKAQQDALLPHVEAGRVTLIGATTENPSFEVNGALLSRCRVFRLAPLGEAAMETLLTRAETAMGRALPLTPDARAALVAMAGGDGRALLNRAEAVFQTGGAAPLDLAALGRVLERRPALYDKKGDAHYDAASVLIKAVRGSDPDGALYWLARMLDAGEDRRFIARRLIILASEDIGLADPRAVEIALAAAEAFDRVGSPEGERFLAQTAVYLALAPKSNSMDLALKRAMRAARESGHAAPPAFAVNAPTKLMKEEGRGAGYFKDHEVEGGYAGRDFFPPSLTRESFYRPTPHGVEERLARRLEELERGRRREE